jgi:hypothetical protein
MWKLLTMSGDPTNSLNFYKCLSPRYSVVAGGLQAFPVGITLNKLGEKEMTLGGFESP